MNNNCGEMREKIADLVSGVLPAAETESVQRHLNECSSCRDYAEALEREDKLLAGLFAEFDANIRDSEDEVINALSHIDTSGQGKIISFGKAVVRNLVARHAAAVAVMVVVTLYFVITLTWILQINACIRHCL